MIPAFLRTWLAAPRWRRAQDINQRLLALIMILAWIALLHVGEQSQSSLRAIRATFVIFPWDLYVAAMAAGGLGLLFWPRPKFRVYFGLTIPVLWLLILVTLYSTAKGNNPVFVLFLDLFYIKLLVNFWGYS